MATIRSFTMAIAMALLAVTAAFAQTPSSNAKDNSHGFADGKYVFALYSVNGTLAAGRQVIIEVEGESISFLDYKGPMAPGLCAEEMKIVNGVKSKAIVTANNDGVVTISAGRLCSLAISYKLTDLQQALASYSLGRFTGLKATFSKV